MLAAIRHARDTGKDSFTLVSHSFELINRRRQALNHVVQRRFSGLLRGLASMPRVETASYAQSPPQLCLTGPNAALPASPFRTGIRMAEQFISNALYGAV
jgi:hypothetical protein